MTTRRAHVVLPADLVRQIDKIAGSRGRSAFLAELARREIKRRRLLEIFKRQSPIWKDADHPELKAGAVKWVRKLRGETEQRFTRIQRRRDQA